MNSLPLLIIPPDAPLPSLAPLNAPRIAQILHYHIASPSVVEAVRQYPRSLSWLHRTLPAIREQVALDLAPLARADTVSVRAFLSLLRAAAPPTNRTDSQVLSQWRGRGLLQNSRYGYLEPQRAAAVLITRRLLPSAIRRWLPDDIAPSEPLWWCWRQDTPTAPITICPVPLPPDLPSSALLWVAWAGAAWLPDWTPLATGALYCGGIQTPQALIDALQTWQLSPQAEVSELLEAYRQADNPQMHVRQTWTRLVSPIVSARFEPIQVQ